MQNTNSYSEGTFICNSECIRIPIALYLNCVNVILPSYSHRDVSGVTLPLRLSCYLFIDLFARIAHSVNPEVEQCLPSVSIPAQPYAEHVCIKHTH